jgi:arylsulfatase A-like enzyme
MIRWIASLALLLFTPALLWAVDRPTRPPNLLLIVSDDQGYADGGCFGGKGILTPSLDRLAKEGVRLTNFYVTWPACTPSRGSILTGRYPQRNGLYDMIRNNEVDFGYQYTESAYAISPEMTLGLDVREVTIAQVLKNAGYATGVVGKWDSGRARRFLPLQRGFDFFYGFANTGIDYWTHERYGIRSLFRGNERIKEDGYATDLFEREARAFIQQNKDRPWFLYLPFNAPHSASSLKFKGVQAQDKYLRLYPDLDPKDNRARYRAALTNMDHAIGSLLNQLKELNQEQNTLVIFFSDNGGSGPSDNGPLRGRKTQLLEGGIRVPFLARWPGVLPAGTVRDDFLSTLEVFPTLTAAAGGANPKGVTLDGFDMLPVLRGQAPSQRKAMFWQRRDDRAARVGSYKWVESEKSSGLFDLSKDIGEQNDLSQKQPEVLAKLKREWAGWRKQMDDAEPRGPFRDY